MLYRVSNAAKDDTLYNLTPFKVFLFISSITHFLHIRTHKKLLLNDMCFLINFFPAALDLDVWQDTRYKKA